MITAVDLLRGLAALIGWRRIEVPGATGYLDTDYAAKGRYAIEALAETDLICVHVEATDEASHEGDAAAKVKALEEIDRHIVGPLHAALRAARATIASWSRPTIPRRCAPRRTATARCRLRSPAAGVAADAAQTYDELAAARVAAGLRRRLEVDGLFSGAEHERQRAATSMRIVHAVDRAKIRRHQRRRQPKDSGRRPQGHSRRSSRATRS